MAYRLQFIRRMKTTISSMCLFAILSSTVAACAVDATPAPGSESTQSPAPDTTPKTETASTQRPAAARDITEILCLATYESVTNSTGCIQYNEPGDPHPPYIYAGHAYGYASPSYASSCKGQGFFSIPMAPCPTGVEVTSGETATLLIESDLNNQAIGAPTCAASYLDYTVYGFNGVLAGTGRVYGTMELGTCQLHKEISFPGDLPQGLNVWVDSYENEVAVIFGNPLILSTAPVGVTVDYMPNPNLAN